MNKCSLNSQLEQVLDTAYELATEIEEEYESGKGWWTSYYICLFNDACTEAAQLQFKLFTPLWKRILIFLKRRTL